MEPEGDTRLLRRNTTLGAERYGAEPIPVTRMTHQELRLRISQQ
jgi:hypothetical protein